MSDFESWLRESCFQAPPLYAKELAQAAWTHQADEISRLSALLAERDAQLAAAEQDAGRYRWLTENASLDWHISYDYVTAMIPAGDGAEEGPLRQLEYATWPDLQDAIDTALESSGGG